MVVENPRLTHYQSVVQHAEAYALQCCAGELLTDDATIQLVLAAIHAFAAGVSSEEIAQAIAEGEERGIVLYGNLQKRNDIGYWQAVRTEAEMFWEKRSDPNAPEDW